MNESLKSILFIFLLNIMGIAAAQKTIVVAQTGKADFRSIQDALNSLPKGDTAQRIILIKKGVYKEKLFVDKNFITLRGASPKNTIITISLSREAWRCDHPDDSGAATINLNGNDIILENLSFINSYGKDNPQEKTIPCSTEKRGIKTIQSTSHQMALRSFSTTRLFVKNCIFTAYGGDTVSPWNVEEGMYYFKDCIMEGGVDFYCPRGWAFAENCLFICHSAEAAIWHDGSKNENAKTVLYNCRFIGVDSFKLGRYHRDAQFYLINCRFAKNMANADIYQRMANPPNTIRWNKRVYYYNTRRSDGDYIWHKNNLPEHLNRLELTPAWAFDYKWKPVREKIMAILSNISAVSSSKIE